MPRQRTSWLRSPIPATSSSALAGAALAVAGWHHETEERKRKFLAEHPQVKIWFDAGGHHARWPVDDDNYTGISHPSELTGLLDGLEAIDWAAQ